MVEVFQLLLQLLNPPDTEQKGEKWEEIKLLQLLW